MNEAVTASEAAGSACAGQREQRSATRRHGGLWSLCGFAFACFCYQFGTAQVSRSAADVVIQPLSPPVRLLDAQRISRQRGQRLGIRITKSAGSLENSTMGTAQSSSSATWTPLGPNAVITTDYGLVTGRVTAVAFDPADGTGNHVYVGTTGGGVWAASNAASDPFLVSFIPLTDNVSMTGAAPEGNLSIGALTVQPGGTGVVLAGTGDPNDVLDSYYGGGILRSTDGGTTWNLIPGTVDQQSGTGLQDFSFVGEAIAGFAWSTSNPQLVVAAVARAYEATLVDAVVPGASYQGLYYSNDSGATWHLATIQDGSTVVQGPVNRFAQPDGNAATAVAWNPERKLFIAAVRFHGYYQSADGVTWTRISGQPGGVLKPAICTVNAGLTGSTACPIFRGALAVDPQSGDTYVWTVDANEQDQGLWQDRCQLSGGVCASPDFTFDTRWDTAALETNTVEGSATVVNGVYTLALAAIPQQQTAMVLAGANDLWQATCPVSQGCAWRNTTNSATCMSAQVGLFQHVAAWPELAWEQAGVTQRAELEQEIFLGNDSGLWRSLDGIAESGAVCNSADASHFQNLNGSLGSLAEVQSLSAVFATPYTLMASLGVNGAAGIKSDVATTDWPQILGGYGGPIAIDPIDQNNWYVNAQAGVDIHVCSTSSPCTPADFGSSPVVANADVGGDGATMPEPAPFLVDPLDHTQLLVATCRLWRGRATGGWSAANAISPIFDSPASPGPCQGNALMRTLAAAPLSATREVVYVGMYGAMSAGGRLGGHVLKAILDTTAASAPTWIDLTASPVSNDGEGFNAYGLDISSIAIDNHDATGDTVYVTVGGMAEPTEPVQTVYRSTDGGASWNAITSNLPNAPANALAVDPQNASVVYVATDQGVAYTTQVDSCAQAAVNCWSQFRSGLPGSPVRALSASPFGAPSPVLVAGTYGRGIWQTPLWTSSTAGTGGPTDTLTPTSVNFSATASGEISEIVPVTIANDGALPLHVQSITVSAGFQQKSDCLGGVAAHTSCVVSVQFAPTQAGTVTGALTITDELRTQTVTLSGTGLQQASITVSPSSLNFPQQQPGVASTPQAITVTNSGGVALANIGLQFSGPGAADYAITAKTCGATLNSGANCTVQVGFTPPATGDVAATLAISSSTPGANTAEVQLNGSGELGGGIATNPAQLLVFPSAVGVGKESAAQIITVKNSTNYVMSAITLTVTGPFRTNQNTCIGALAAGALCTVAVIFEPTTSGAANGTLVVSSPVVSTPATVMLSGTGFDFAVAVSGPDNITVSSGQSGNFKLKITTIGASGIFSLQCEPGSLPVNSSCRFNPTNPQVDLGVDGYVGVQIYTGSSTTARLAPPNVISGWPAYCALVFAPLLLWRRRHLFLVVLVAVILAAGISSCTSSGGGPSSGQSGQSSSATTPSGTYKIPITVTSKNTEVSRPITLTLTVD